MTDPVATRPGPLRIGPLTVDRPVVLAPMAGVTTPAFRTLCRGYGAGLYVSEMITARALVEGNERTRRMLAPAPGEPVRSVQLYGVDPAVMGLAVRLLVDDWGVDHIDLNFGCPAPKVTRKGGGAALPAHHQLFRRVVAAAVSGAGRVPVTVKMRMGIDERHLTARKAALAAEAEGAAAVTLHARTAEQLYSGGADWSAVAELVDAVRTIPVLGNGDIWTAADALRLVAETGCAGVVIGRGCLGRPWLFADLAAAFSPAGGSPAGVGPADLGGRSAGAAGSSRPLGTAAPATAPPSGTAAPVSAPPLGTVADVMRNHAALLAADLGEERATRDFRRHVGWYLTGYAVGGDVRRRLGLVESLEELDRLLDELDPAVTLLPDAVGLPRGHSAGPRRVALPDGWLDRCDDPTPPAGADAFTSGG